MSHSCKKRAPSVVLVLAAVALASASALDAKVARRTLEDLIMESELVAYGVTTDHDDAAHERDNPIVWFKADSILKSPKGLEPVSSGDIPICEDSAHRDTINLRKYPGAYVVFARKRGDCFSPVAGYKSLIPIKEGVARTADIDEQPDTERLDAFLAKIRRLLQGPNSARASRDK